MGKRAGKGRTPGLSSSEPLERFNLLRTSDPAELQERLESHYAIKQIELPRGKARFKAVLNQYRLQNVTVGYGRYGAPVKLTMEDNDFYAQGFGICGYGEATVGGRLFKVEGGQGGVAEPDATALLDYRVGFEHVFMKIAPEPLKRTLAALLGTPVGTPFTLRGEYDKQALAAEYRLLCFIITELDHAKNGLPPLLLAQFDHALIVAYLCANLSNYSDQLNAKSPAKGPWQVQRAMDYVEANWDRPITIEALASATESSARSLFATFRKSHGCSPMAFVKHFRLLRANEILSRAAPGTSVTSVAAKCGFRNPGHFARKYSNLFGELPSEALKRAKRGSNSRG
jgi:AraC-like DNA-binding protein